ncbi:hypothetical protein [Mongoliibacter ruber]|uniref:Uncharacterized protein n=1 Tax=Mongoliibacter ruber TaxID=1750599 RepID=A0A2T0WD70_9BACT|nr:hypothetical protein [Mongoliibacter ruber]PRY84474.1 hypothetical protein CLW00_12020 [Mongoliibacter ruber]
MRKDFLQHLWMIILFLVLCGLLVWGVWLVEKVENQISIFGIVAVIIAAFTSVLTVSINNRKAKEREYDLHVLKEKQKVFEHFYNSFFDLLEGSKKGKQAVSAKNIKEMMLFKQGLMNWGSEHLIREFIEYDNKLTQQDNTFNMLEDGNKFLKEIRKEMGFSDSKNLNLIDIILTAEAREELRKVNQ